MGHDEILTDYDQHLFVLQEIETKIKTFVIGLLDQENIKPHSIVGRLKSRDSLKDKLSRPEKSYYSLWEVTDLVGVRITTHFEDSIELIAELIEKHFTVDFHHSVDRLKFKDFRNFGYRSLHCICEWDPEKLQTTGLPKEFRFEIQIRTILQHAWAEIEHDLGYKASDSTPESIRRRFSRLAGLLEIADEEFVAIRRDLKSYEESVIDTFSDPLCSFPLDRISLQSIVLASEVVELDREVAGIFKKPLSEQLFFPEYLLKMLKFSGYKNTREVRADLKKYRELVLKIIHPYFEFTQKAWKLTTNDLDFVQRGYSLFFLSHVAILRSPILEMNKITKLAKFYRELDYPNDEQSANEVAIGLVETLKVAGYLTVPEPMINLKDGVKGSIC